MTEVPKIVHDRLRTPLPGQAALEQSHPDPDLLAAFTEQALLPNERDCVLGHLAQCGDCREVLALAMPAPEIVATVVADGAEETGAAAISGRPDKRRRAETKRSWEELLGFSHLRWAAPAACVVVVAVVVASVLVLHPGKVSQPPLQSTRQSSNWQSKGASDSDTVTAATSVPPGSSSSSSVASSPVTSSPMATQSVAPAADAAKRGKARPRSQMEFASALRAGQMAQPDSESLLARNEAPPIEKAKPAPIAAGAQNLEASAEGTAQEKTDTAVAPGTVADGVSVAKLAPAPGVALASHNVSWTIAAGLLQRSLDSGQSWQTALRADHPLLCYASLDDEVWVGGQAGTLFHSADNGVSWVQVQPSIPQTFHTQVSRPIERLSSDVSYIDFRSAKEIVLTTAEHAIWRSADGGKTWEAK